MFMNMYVHGYVYVYDSICWALKCPVHCAEPFLELKICISPQFRAIDPPNPARGFIQQNENVRFATAACMQKYGNVSFATVACAKCMRYGGGGPIPWGGGGGGWQHGTRHHVYLVYKRYILPIGWLYATDLPPFPFEPEKSVECVSHWLSQLCYRSCLAENFANPPSSAPSVVKCSVTGGGDTYCQD